MECNLLFSTTPSADTGSFKLIELPPDLCKLVEAGSSGNETTK